MTQTAKNGLPTTRLATGLAGRLLRTRAAVRIAIVVERLWPLVLPLVIVASLFASASWLGVFRAVPDWARLALAAALALAALAGLYPLRFFRAPTPAEIDRRIERANRLEHAPLNAQSDRPAAGDAFAHALWREHQKRMAARLHRLGADLPHARLPERDPWGLRAAAALLLVVAFAFSFGPLGGTLGDALRAHGGKAAVPARIDAWVTPPAYTGRAPIFLTAQAADNAQPAVTSVPQGSVVAVRVAGGDGMETLNWLKAGAEEPVAIVPDAAKPQERRSRRDTGTPALQFSTTLEEDGLLSLSADGRTLQGWAFAVVPDAPPSIRFAHEPGSAVNGTLELSIRSTTITASPTPRRASRRPARRARRPPALRPAGDEAGAAAPQRRRQGRAHHARPDRASVGGSGCGDATPPTPPARRRRARKRPSCCPSGPSPSRSPGRWSSSGAFLPSTPTARTACWR